MNRAPVAEVEKEMAAGSKKVPLTVINQALITIRQGDLPKATRLLVRIKDAKLGEALDSLMGRGYRVEAVLLALCADHVECAKRMIAEMGADGNRGANLDQFHEILERWTECYPQGPTTKLVYAEVVEQIVDPAVPLREAVVAILKGDAETAICEMQRCEPAGVENAVAYLLESDQHALASLMILAYGDNDLKRRYFGVSTMERSIRSLEGPWRQLALSTSKRR